MNQLSRRDLLAGMAMRSAITALADKDAVNIAQYSVEVADALIAELDKTTPSSL